MSECDPLTLEVKAVLSPEWKDASEIRDEIERRGKYVRPVRRAVHNRLLKLVDAGVVEKKVVSVKTSPKFVYREKIKE